MAETNTDDSRESLSASEAAGQDYKYSGGSARDGQLGRGYSPNRQNKTWAKKNRQSILIAGGASSILLIFGVLFLSLFLPSLKLAHLAAEIEGYRMARLSRTFYKEAGVLTADRTYLDAAGDVSTADLVGKTPIGKALSLYKPTRVVDNMKANSVLGFEYSNNRLNNVILNGNKISVPDYGYKSLSDLKNNYAERVRFAAQVQSGVNQALDGSNYFVRSAVSKRILSSYGITLQWWEKLGAGYKGTTEAEADRLVTQQAAKKIDTPSSPNDIKTALLKNAVQDAEQAKSECLLDPNCTDWLARYNGLPPQITDVIDKDTKITATNQALGVINPVYGVMFPVCLVYDGSASASKEYANYLNNQNAAAMKTFFAVASADSQNKKEGTTGEALAAFNRHIGDISTSIPNEIASGNSTVNTSAEVSPQATRAGEFTIFDALFGGGKAGGVADSIADNVCPAMTDLKVAISVGILNVVAGFASLGQSAEAEAGAETASEGLVATITSKLTTLVTDPVGRAAIKNTAKKYAAGSIKSGASTEGLTYLSRMIVLAEMGQFFSGTDSSDFANQADMGAVAYSNQMNQQQLYGRPLTTSEASSVQTEDNSYVVAQNGKNSTFQKYFAISNPYSLAGTLAVKASAIHFADMPGFLINLPHVLGSIFAPLSHVLNGHSFAAASDSNLNYNMVQFGWSADEESLINTNASYDPLVNAQILADSGQSDAITAKYGKCFNEDIGTMLTNGDINRDSDGNVENSGNCAPSKLSIGNPEFDNDNCRSDSSLSSINPASGNSCNNLIFRWRLDQSYQNVQGELNGIQDPSASTVTSASTVGGSLPTGSAQQLAQQLVPYVNNGTIKCAGDGQGNIGCSDITNTANAIPIKMGEGCGVDALQPQLVGMLLKLVQMGHTFTLSAICSDHHNDGPNEHAGGKAADFNTIDGTYMGPSATAPWTSEKIQAAQKLDQDIASFMPTSTGFGQIQCHPTFSFLNGFNTFNDDCHHQHVQVGS